MFASTVKFIDALLVLKKFTILNSKLKNPLIIKNKLLYRHIHLTKWHQWPKIIPFILSDIGEGTVEVVVKEWYVKTGDNISQFDPLCEVQSDKASVTITSRYDGEISKLYYQPDEIAKVGRPLLDIVVSDEAKDECQVSSPNEASEKQLDTNEEKEEYLSNKSITTPAVRRIAKENRIDLKKVAPSGKGGRILKEDVLKFLQNPPTTNANDKVEEITGVRKAMAKAMTKSLTIPHFTYSDEVNVTEMTQLKSELRRLGEKNNIKITYMPLFLKAASQALLKYPMLNSHITESLQLKFLQSHNIGVAVDTPSGLVVPTVKDVQHKNIVQIAKDLQALQKAALEDKLRPEDLASGTFTLSNIGAIGGTYASPVIMSPQVAIGALGKIQTLPRYATDGKLLPTDILIISWSADHRIVDGATMARFSNLFKAYLENPKLLLQL